MWVQSLGRKNPLQKEMETHSSILAWRIPWTSSWSPKEPKSLVNNTTTLSCILKNGILKYKHGNCYIMCICPLLKMKNVKASQQFHLSLSFCSGDGLGGGIESSTGIWCLHQPEQSGGLRRSPSESQDEPAGPQALGNGRVPCPSPGPLSPLLWTPAILPLTHKRCSGCLLKCRE